MKAIRQHSHRTGALSADEITTILRMSADGATTTEIARALGRSPINMGMMVHNVKLRRGSRPKTAPSRTVTAARPGESEAETIARHIAKHGITRVEPGHASNTRIAVGLDMSL